VPKLTIILATATSMVLMLALFAVAALAVSPVPQTAAKGAGKARPAAGICFLHDLL
jgi:hypothetical protein